MSKWVGAALSKCSGNVATWKKQLIMHFAFVIQYESNAFGWQQFATKDSENKYILITWTQQQYKSISNRRKRKHLRTIFRWHLQLRTNRWLWLRSGLRDNKGLQCRRTEAIIPFSVCSALFITADRTVLIYQLIVWICDGFGILAWPQRNSKCLSFD